MKCHGKQRQRIVTERREYRVGHERTDDGIRCGKVLRCCHLLSSVKGQVPRARPLTHLPDPTNPLDTYDQTIPQAQGIT
jgi:hypothetical protein